MSWVKHYHDDHMAVMRLLAKLEGNIKEIEMGEKRTHLNLELEEFARVIREVIIPHFKHEETGIYARIAEVSEEERDFINRMLEEHRRLYVAFEDYLSAVDSLDEAKLAAAGKIIIDILAKHIKKEELVIPKIAAKLDIS
ncbi:hemerythrin domain-containing protein [Metallumcola ferriviriculae]|uniref:Hemerythrin domain-containing protein n=1 Tax=Metallumcola ferriviriculae TaxID=3039180 RepID=A0AAU0UPS3_9FIRM|nr:hemerythrin domain-containing protein [Desulfitibacteraceae bacterium MK1]